MKITKSFIKQIIMEELSKLDEGINTTPAQEKNTRDSYKAEYPGMSDADINLVLKLQNQIDRARNKTDSSIPDAATLKAEYQKQFPKVIQYLKF